MYGMSWVWVCNANLSGYLNNTKLKICTFPSKNALIWGSVDEIKMQLINNNNCFSGPGV